MTQATSTNHGDLVRRALALLDEQKREWPTLRDGRRRPRHRADAQHQAQRLRLPPQFNPQRRASSAAKVDAKTIAQRRCFLCPANLPREQRAVPFDGTDYLILCNPFPIFPQHFTIPHKDHLPQRIAGEPFAVMLDLARAMQDRYTVFYNGPRCGASAPDHLHFQSGDRGFMTIEHEYGRLKGEPIVTTPAATFTRHSRSGRSCRSSPPTATRRSPRSTPSIATSATSRRLRTSR
jgi:hypothetical protein